MRLFEVLKGCEVPADLYKVVIPLENLATPAELRELAPDVDRLPPLASEWFRRMETMMSVGLEATQPYERVEVTKDVTLFKGAGGEPGERRLLVSFCGAYPYRPLAIPTPAFLQHVPSDRFDVLALRDPAQVLFLRGIEGFGKDIAGIARRLVRAKERRGYRGIRCLGMSAGGAAALVAGILADAECAVEFGGVHPTAKPLNRRVFAAGFDGMEFERALEAAAPVARVKSMCIFAADNQGDREGGRALQRMVPWAVTVEVTGMDSHHVPFEMLKQGRLKKLLQRTVLGDLDWSSFNPARRASP